MTDTQTPTPTPTPTATDVGGAVAAPPVVRTAVVDRSADDAFRIFTEEIGAWWPVPTHGLYGDRSGGVRFDDGRLIEIAVDGTETTWGEVVAWEPPARLVITWHPGSDPADGDPASRVEVSFDPEDAVDRRRTRVTIRHDGWEAFGDDAVRRRRGYAGPNAWGYVLDHFADGAEPNADAPDLADLAAAYDAFFAVAESGGFGDPPEGEWGAAQVIAHVALNDLAMSAVAQSLVHRGEPRFENLVCQDPDNLARVIEATGDLAALVAFGRAASVQAMAAVRRLDEEQRAHPVHCRLLSDGEVMLDDARPWELLAVTIQTGMHLPAHTEQLESLRS